MNQIYNMYRKYEELKVFLNKIIEWEKRNLLSNNSSYFKLLRFKPFIVGYFP